MSVIVIYSRHVTARDNYFRSDVIVNFELCKWHLQVQVVMKVKRRISSGSRARNVVCARISSLGRKHSLPVAQ